VKKISALIVDWLRQGIKTSWYMFKFMIPISVVVKILQETGLIVHVGNVLSPLMKLMGLPGEMGLVWASSMIANIYGSLIAYLQIVPMLENPLTIAQVTTLATIILIAHTFLIELVITQRAGAKIVPMFVIRFGFGFVAGVLVFWMYHFLGVLQDYPEVVNTLLMGKKDPTLLEWGLNELRNYGFIFLCVTGLIILLDILKRVGIINKINNLLEPVLRILGIGKDVIPITVVGMTLGLAYGGGLIINSVNRDGLKKRDVLYALFLMALCHSVIEDSLLLISIGAHYTGVFIFRICFALIITYIFVKITSKWSEEKMSRWFYAKN
jgi:spore maturation protein SpmB